MIRNTYREFYPDKPIALVGMPGVGKTTLGKLLADFFGIPFFDSDNMVEKAAGGLSVSTIYEQFGEEVFRSTELAVIQRILGEESSHVLATGEGAFLEDQTRILLLEKTCTVYMYASLSHLAARLSRKVRPQLGLPLKIDGLKLDDESAKGEEEKNLALEKSLEKMYEERDKFYRLADVWVPSDQGGYEDTLSKILDALKSHFHIM
ncbi:shikimate kinase [Holospora obtusa F1]|uniref:Shikimate kinase n=1 Tax=Holospora obtusa F1 TaxID=1399147 RepID=W6TEH5_HOLOB|nr:shikimate kinase [Holospora obtusa]ETZ07663.1 shikimate kinase [Holospora obtusa F1]